MTMSLLLCLVLAGGARGVSQSAQPGVEAGSAQMVADLSPGASFVSLNPSGMAVMRGVAYFSGQDEANGTELWRSDGTEAGTRLVRDLRAGPQSSTPGELTPIGGLLYLLADDGQGGMGLWRTDGSAEGFELLKRPFARERPTQLRAAGGRVVFALGTRLLVFEEGVGVHVIRKDVDLCAGEGLAQGERSVSSVVNGRLAYYLVGCSASERLWRTDGTRVGTYEVAQIGAQQAYEPQIVTVGGALYLTRNLNGSGELWRSDGTAAGTSLVTVAAGRLSWLTPVGARLFFTSGGPSFGGTVQVSDGTPAGTSVVATVGADEIAGALADFNGVLLFSTWSWTSGALWRSDGTPVGTFPLAPLEGVSAIRSFGGRALAYSTRTTAGAPAGLWSTDGTMGGLQLLAGASWLSTARPLLGSGRWQDRYLCEPGLVDLGGQALFRSGKGMTCGSGELWRTDGTPAGTGVVLAAASGHSTWPSQLATTTDAGLFFTQDRSRLPEGSPKRLYVSDGSATGTRLVREWSAYWPPYLRDDLDGLTALGNSALFYLSTSESSHGGVDLWRSDGSASGTEPLWLMGYADADVWRFGWVPPYVWQGRAYFPGSTNGTSYLQHSLVRTDGSKDGTEPVLALCSLCPCYPAGSGPQLAAIGSRLVVSTGDAPQGAYCSGVQETRVLWRNDAGAAPVHIAKLDVEQIVSLGGRFYFVGRREADREASLWRSDGTTESTLRVTPLPRGSAQLTAAGTRLYFVAPDATMPGRRTLWVSDGTAAGTRVVLPGGPLDPEGLTAVGSSVFFSAWQPGTGREPWRSDGTAAGTLLVQDVFPGRGGSISEGTAFTAAADRVYFAAASPTTGRELWSSDGTAAGTQLVQDIAEGPASSNPDEPTLAGSRLYFRADDGADGAELWTLPIGPARPRLAATTAIPRTAQAHVASDEAEAIEALRRIGAAANAYLLGNGAYPSNLTCLADPAGENGGACPPGLLGNFTPGMPAWLPRQLAGMISGVPGVSFLRAGYLFRYAQGSSANGAWDTGSDSFTLTATPVSMNVTGQRHFVIDQSGRICQSLEAPFLDDGQGIPAGCTEI